MLALYTIAYPITALDLQRRTVPQCMGYTKTHFDREELKLCHDKMAPISHNQNRFLTYFEGAEHKYKSHFSRVSCCFMTELYFLIVIVCPVHRGTFSCMSSVQQGFLVRISEKQQRVISYTFLLMSTMITII